MSKKTKEFTSKMIGEVTGLKVNTLHYYINSGAIIPDIELGEGTGHSRRFSETNCLEAKIIKLFIQSGIPKRTIVNILKKIRENGDRNRLDPRKLQDKKSGITEFLLIWPVGEEVQWFIYRFISDGGDKYTMTRREWDSRVMLTSFDGVESIRDFLAPGDVSIVINLSNIRSVPMREYKLGESGR